MSKRTQKSNPTVPERGVYELRVSGHTQVIEATSTGELRDTLTSKLVGIDVTALQAIVRFATVERAAITTAT
jgi:hypothetical protein